MGRVVDVVGNRDRTRCRPQPRVPRPGHAWIIRRVSMATGT
jgi:hypothetical protein